VEALGGMLVSLGAIFLSALLFDAIGRKTPLHRVTLLMLFGFVAGPSVLDFLPDITQVWFPFVANMALVMVGFLLGGQLTLGELRERGGPVMRISLAVVLVTFAVVALGLFLIGVPVVAALLLAALSTATDPAATIDVVHENGSDGPFARTLLDIVAVDDAWGLILFSMTLAVCNLAIGNGAGPSLLHGAWDVGGALLLGAALGAPMAYLTGRIERGEPTLYEALGLVFLCGGIAMLLNVSFLLAAMTMGAVVANLAHDHTRPFHAIEGIEWPFMVLFFVLAGASLEMPMLTGAGIWLVAYVVLRIVGRLLGGWIGGSVPVADPPVRRWMGMALLPQAGVALGMALVAGQQFPEVGEAILPVVVAATVLFELIGPIATQLALRATSES
jgi:Kef-type K+ transport system membrane component KefB